MAATVSLARLLELPEHLQAEVVTRVRRRVLKHLLLAAKTTSRLALMGLTSISSASLLRCPVGVSRPLPLPSVTRLNVTTAFSDVLSDLLGCNPAFAGRLNSVHINEKAIMDGRTISNFREVSSFDIDQECRPGVVDMLGEMSRFTRLRHLTLDLIDEDDPDADVNVGIAAALALVSRNTSLEHLDIVWRPTTHVTVTVSGFSSLTSLGVTGCCLHWQDLLTQLQPLTSLRELTMCVEEPLLRGWSPQHDGITGLTCLMMPHDTDREYVEEIETLSKALPNVRNLRLDPVGIVSSASTYQVVSAWRHCTRIQSLELEWDRVDPIGFCAALHECFGRLTRLTVLDIDTVPGHALDFRGMLCFLASKMNLQVVEFRTSSSDIPAIQMFADSVAGLFRRPGLFVFELQSRSFMCGTAETLSNSRLASHAARECGVKRLLFLYMPD